MDGNIIRGAFQKTDVKMAFMRGVQLKPKSKYLPQFWKCQISPNMIKKSDAPKLRLYQAHFNYLSYQEPCQFYVNFG